MIPLLQFRRLPYQNYDQKIPKTGNSWVLEGHNHDWHLEKLLLPIDLKEKFWSSYKSVLLFIIHFKCSIVDRFGMILQVCSLFVRARCIAWFSITGNVGFVILSYRYGSRRSHNITKKLAASAADQLSKGRFLSSFRKLWNTVNDPNLFAERTFQRNLNEKWGLIRIGYVFFCPYEKVSKIRSYL